MMNVTEGLQIITDCAKQQHFSTKHARDRSRLSCVGASTTAA